MYVGEKMSEPLPTLSNGLSVNLSNLLYELLPYLLVLIYYVWSVESLLHNTHISFHDGFSFAQMQFLL